MPESSRLRGRAVAFAVSLAASLVLAEIAYRALEPPPLAQSFIADDDGRAMPLGEMIRVLQREPSSPETAATDPRGRLKPGIHLKFCYDRPEWAYFDAGGCVSVNVNRLGFRDLEFAVKKRPGERRILAVGDSFTFGSGVQLEDTWPQILERLLSEGRSTPVEVINGGFAAGGHTPAHYADWVGSHGAAFSPDLVIVGLCLNDLSPRVGLLSYPVVEVEPFLGGVSRIVDAIRREIEQRRVVAATYDATLLVELDPTTWNDTQAGLRQMRDDLAHRSIRYLVAILPMLSQLGPRHPNRGLHRLVAEFCGQEGIDCLDLLPAFEGRAERSLWVHPTDQHPNDVGNRILAEGIRDHLVRRGSW
jgi:lysophospholipase L1-like esterase